MHVVPCDAVPSNSPDARPRWSVAWCAERGTGRSLQILKTPWQDLQAHTEYVGLPG